MEGCMKRIIITILALLTAPALFAAGTLTVVTSGNAPIQIKEHLVNVIIDNGFARTEVVQTFFNPNDKDLEAVYEFPVLASASLAEITIRNGERTLNGEVIAAEEAKKVYTEERDAGNDAGLGECSCTKPKAEVEYNSYKFSVSPVRANSETKIRFVYYQPLTIDSGMGRYVYPLQEGGTEEAAKNFWTRNPKVEEHFAINIELRSGWPVEEVRTPGADDANVTKLADGQYKVIVDRTSTSLDHDFIFYYRLADNLPGRVELMTYKPKADQPGTFMLTVTPGADLAPIGETRAPSQTSGMTYSESITVNASAGGDYIFVLDISGSMRDKLPVLARGVEQALTHFKTGDRFRIFVFNGSVRELTSRFVNANPQSAAEWSRNVEILRAHGGTNVYAGLEEGLHAVEGGRVTSILLVTDGVTNMGITDPKGFHALLKRHDVRVFGFLMGNNGNWPLMRLITETSGGFYDVVSNDGDIVGAILLAKSKIVSEAMHDAKLTIDGVKTFDRTDDVVRKIYRGQQLVIFGRYEKSGPANVTLAARMTGADATYKTRFDFPDVSTDYPELERMWAMAGMERVVMKENAGFASPEDAKTSITALGIKYQLVTDYTSMIVLSDDDFAKRGIERTNAPRIVVEEHARASRGAPRSTRVDGSRPMFNGSAPTMKGAGAVDPIVAILAAIAVFAVLRTRSK
jgi:Ca-activated chloride channel family protein